MGDVMNNIVDVTGGSGGKVFLLLGTEKTALIDAGMAYCASALVDNIKQILHSRKLDYILISHSHYDHVGAIPFIKAKWPDSQVLGSEYDCQVLMKPNALRAIRMLSTQAASIYGSDEPIEYDDTLLRVDQVICGGDYLEIGGMIVQVVATPGHTQSSFSFLVNQEILFASESTGYMSKSGAIYPSFITSYTEALNSIKTCQKLNPRWIVSPHYGLVDCKSTPNYWENCLQAMQQTREFIVHLAEQGYDMGTIFNEYEKRFRDDDSRLEQPLEAFKLNTLPMIRTILDDWSMGTSTDHGS